MSVKSAIGNRITSAVATIIVGAIVSAPTLLLQFLDLDNWLFIIPLQGVWMACLWRLLRDVKAEDLFKEKK